MMLRGENMLKDLALEQLLQEISSKSPTPSGGTVAGLVAALSSALISMVCNLTIGKKSYQQYEDEIKKILENSEKLKLEFILLAEKDIESFDEVMSVYSLPHESEEDKDNRKLAVEEATKKAAMVPMDMLRRCELISELSLSVALKGNENSINDAGVAAILANAAAQAASLNILINLSTISDEDFIGKLKTEQAKVLNRIKNFSDETMQIVNSKL